MEDRHEVLLDDLLATAWAVIANAGGGNWDTQTSEWKGAAERWRDRYLAVLPAQNDRVERIEKNQRYTVDETNPKE